MKNRFIIAIIMFSLLALGCKNNQRISFDLSIIDNFLDYKNVVEKYKSQINVNQIKSDCKEEYNGIIIVGKDFKFIYNDVFYYDENNHFFQLECSNSLITLNGIKVIGKREEEILTLITTTPEVEVQKNENFISYTILKSEPAPLNLSFKLKNHKVTSYTLGFML